MVPKTLTEEEMYAAILASDEAYNGRFVTGVLTTGIYCIPSCHARKPKRENVRFFSTFDDARQEGLRACRKCKPDEFERGEDRELAALEMLVGQLRRAPDRIAGVPDLAEAIGWGTTKLHEAVRKHYHRTPADLVAEARLDLSRDLLRQGAMPVTEVCFAVGFDSVSTFNSRFREATGLTPSGYRDLPSSNAFTIQLPADANLEPLRGRAKRDSDGVIESFDGETYRRAVTIGDQPATLELKLGPTKVEVQVHGENPDMFAAHRMVSRILGLGQDPRGFEAHCAKLGADRLFEGRQGVRIALTPTVFDGLIWAIVGQQVNLTFARTLRRRLAETYGSPAPLGLTALPTPAQLAGQDPESFVPLQFSRRKAEYLIGVAQLSPTGFEELTNQSATRIEQTLMAIRGLGVWSTHYLMMRALGFADCVPLGDTGLAAGLKRHFALEASPKQPEQKALMEAFSPYRSLATYHLWQSLKDSA